MAEKTHENCIEWLESECLEDMLKQAGIPAYEVNINRSQSLHITEVETREPRRVKILGREGR